MMTIKQMAVDAVNEYILGLQGSIPDDDFLLAISVFNSNVGTERVVDYAPVRRLRPVSHEQYRPDGSTPLYDAMAAVIQELDGREGARLVIVQTDGEENASQKYRKERIADMIRERTKQGWQFVYLGCNFDAMRSGELINVDIASRINVRSPHLRRAYSLLAQATSEYYAGGSTRASWRSPTPTLDDTSEDDTPS
jgi:hypothetical protein